jgi:hypothetical protein
METEDWRPYLHASCWRRRAEDGGGAERDDATAPEMEEDSAPPSPIRGRAGRCHRAGDGGGAVDGGGA